MTISRNLKEDILNCAKNIAIKEGISKINMRLVAKELDVALGTIYNYYPTKGDIISEVIEDFWRNAFSNINFSKINMMDNISALEYIYFQLLNYMERFKENWLHELSLLKAKDKDSSMKREKEYFQRVNSIILELISKSEKLNLKYTLEERQRLATFIFDNMLIMLKRNERDFKFFRKILLEILD